MKLKACLLAAAAAVALNVSTPKAQAGAAPFLGDIMTVGFNFCPRGWADADGRLLPIASYSALFSLYGTTYGGDGRTTFGIPDLRSRFAMGQGSGLGLTPRRQGQKFGSESVIMTTQNMPTHNHLINTTEATPNTHDPNGSIFATFAAPNNIYTN